LSDISNGVELSTFNFPAITHGTRSGIYEPEPSYVLGAAAARRGDVGPVLLELTDGATSGCSAMGFCCPGPNLKFVDGLSESDFGAHTSDVLSALRDLGAFGSLALTTVRVVTPSGAFGWDAPEDVWWRWVWFMEGYWDAYVKLHGSYSSLFVANKPSNDFSWKGVLLGTLGGGSLVGLLWGLKEFLNPHSRPALCNLT
jgi:hypothetical protein